VRRYPTDAKQEMIANEVTATAAKKNTGEDARAPLVLKILPLLSR